MFYVPYHCLICFGGWGCSYPELSSLWCPLVLPLVWALHVGLAADEQLGSLYIGKED